MWLAPIAGRIIVVVPVVVVIIGSRFTADPCSTDSRGSIPRIGFVDIMLSPVSLSAKYQNRTKRLTFFIIMKE